MKTIEISLTIHLPDGVELATPAVRTTEQPVDDPFEVFWRELGLMAKKMFHAAALIETSRGPGYTFEEIALEMGEGQASVLAYHRNSSRTGRWWEQNYGAPSPIRFENIDPVYDKSGAKRQRVRLPQGVAEMILDLHQTDNGVRP
jgi:hypothetical protein